MHVFQHQLLPLEALSVTPETRAKFTPYVPSGEVLPDVVDITQWFGPVMNQLTIGWCTAFALACWFECLRVMAGYLRAAISDSALYFAEREIEGTVGEDSGATTDTAIAVIETMGPLPESDDPTNPATYNNPPPTADWEPNLALAAENCRFISKNYEVGHETDLLNAVKDALAHNHPILFPMSVFAGIESAACAHTGLMPLPAADENPIGAHELVGGGYDDQKMGANWTKPGAIRARNSWGPWGDGGDLWIPYEFFAAYVGEAVVGFAPPGPAQYTMTAALSTSTAKVGDTVQLTVTTADATGPVPNQPVSLFLEGPSTTPNALTWHTTDAQGQVVIPLTTTALGIMRCIVNWPAPDSKGHGPNSTLPPTIEWT